MGQSAMVTGTASQVQPARTGLLSSRIFSQLVLYVLIVLLSLSFAMPLVWMISTSLKTDPQVYRVPPIWIPNPARFQNYLDVLTRRPFGLWFANTLRYCLLSTLGVVLSSALVAYSFARLRWWGRNILFFLCIATMMVPFQVQMIPLYIVFRQLGWVNSYLPLIVPTYFGNAYFIFLSDHSAGAFGRRPRGRRFRSGDLVADHPAAGQTGAGRSGALPIYGCLERLSRPAHLSQPGDVVPAVAGAAIAAFFLC
jgi:hypothetical protein